MDNIGKELFVFAGANGSGKSTIINNFRNNGKCPKKYICPDLIVDKSEKDSVTAYINAMQLCEQLRYDAVINGESFSFETVLSNPDKLDFIKFAQKHGYTVTAIYIVTKDPKINIERVAERVRFGGHNVPTDKIVSRDYKTMELMSAGIRQSDRAMVYDTSDKDMELLMFKDSGEVFFGADGVLQQEKSWINQYIINV
jgi:predicted ABC-type ATPase